ncbi:MAG: MBL fold metallo-hydrolase [Ilumatobacteraceae bacterium]
MSSASAADRPTITFVGHASVAIQVAGTTILTDPVLTDRLKHLRRVGAVAEDFDPATIDVVAISHQHHDHLHVASLKRLPRSAHAVVPRGLGTKVAKLGFERVSELTVGESVDHDRVTITAVPAHHDDHRHPGMARIEPLGYVFDADGWSAYFPGDTDVYPEMADLHPDLTLIPVWGWGPTLGGGHLDPERAAEALELLGSRTAIPIHWGTLWPYHVRRNDRLTLPPKELADAVHRRGLDVDVIEVPPGGTVTL